MSKFSSFFGKLGRGTAHVFTSPALAHGAVIAGEIITPLNPGIGALVEMIATAAVTVETAAAASKQTVSGAEKKEQVKAIIDVAAPVVTSVLDGVAGSAINPATVAPALSETIDATVALLNALGVFTHAQALVPAAAPPAKPLGPPPVPLL